MDYEKNNDAYFTSGEFAKLHHINKRTLHYYDDIGLFSPQRKGDNGYRYYTYRQSMELEHILALRELDLSIEEIIKYMQNPNPTDFNRIAESRIIKIDRDIIRLKQLKSILQRNMEMLSLCQSVQDGKIEIVEQKGHQYLLMTPLTLNFETEESWTDQTESIMEHLTRAWELSSYKKSCGSYLSIEKIYRGRFQEYDGIFTEAGTKATGLYRKSKGRYLRGYSTGDWDKIPDLYEKMIKYARQNQLALDAYAFESGLNEFAIREEQDYMAQIEIRIL